MAIPPIPHLSEIAKDPEFEAAEIARDEFERVWARRREPFC